MNLGDVSESGAASMETECFFVDVGMHTHRRSNQSKNTSLLGILLGRVQANKKDIGDSQPREPSLSERISNTGREEASKRSCVDQSVVQGNNFTMKEYVAC